MLPLGTRLQGGCGVGLSRSTSRGNCGANSATKRWGLLGPVAPAVRFLSANVAKVDRTTDRDARTRARIEQHWKASEDGDADTEHAIYAEDAILDYPQSGERFRGRPRIQAQRGGHPAERHFTILRIRGGGDLWVSECVITYDGVPTYAVSVMEFTGDLVTHETQYFADPFQAPAWRAALAEPIPGRDR